MTGRRLLEGMSTPRAPQRLRARALAAARAELTGRARTTLVDRLWGNRTLRWAWAAACTALVLGHLVAGPEAPAASIPSPRATVVAVNDPLVDWLISNRPDATERDAAEASRRLAEILELELS